MPITHEQAQQLHTGRVLTATGGKVGSIGQVYLDDMTGEPSWVTAQTGLFGRSESFVPLQGARLDGADVIVDYDEDTIKNAPRIDPDGHLEPPEEDALYRYYDLDSTDHAHRIADQSTRTTATGQLNGTGGDGPFPAEETVGQDRSGPTTDDAMTWPEEQLRVGVAHREAGRARLRKHVTTEQVTQTVPVSHDEVVLHREVPVVDENVVRKEQVEVDHPQSCPR